MRPVTRHPIRFRHLPALGVLLGAAALAFAAFAAEADAPALPVPPGERIFAADFSSDAWAGGPAEPQLAAQGFGWTALQPAGWATLEIARAPDGSKALRSHVPGTPGQTNKSMSTVEGSFPPKSVVTMRAEYLLPLGPDGRVTVFDLESKANRNAGVRFQLQSGAMLPSAVLFNRDKLRVAGAQPVFIGYTRIPTNTWFWLTVEVTADAGMQGRVRIWIDDRKAFETTGSTLGDWWTYDRVQFGITGRLEEYGPLELWTRHLEVWAETPD